QRKDVINHIPTGEVDVGSIGTVAVGAVGSTHVDSAASSNDEVAESSQGTVGSPQSQDENFRLKGATVVSNLAIAGGKKVEQFKNWLGEDNAETAALVLMAAAGGPVKTLGSTLWAATPMAGYLQEKKEQYLVNPLTPLIGANAFGAETDSDQQAVRPASHATSSMLVDTLLSSIGALGIKAGATGIIKSSDGFSAKVEGADNAFSFSGGKPAVAGDSYHPSSVVERSKSNRDYYGEANSSNEFPAGTVNYESHSTAKLEQSKVPRDLNEQVLWNRVKDDPSKGKPLKLNNDPNFPREDGWQKMEVTHRLPDGNSITIHYQYNERTGKAYDMKVVTPQYNKTPTGGE
ncbi:hypothetical protein LL974_16960, partial [Xanthomonas campestris pv. cannae]|nr:hypothetical protein [Xanthomonas campestris pv. cannae]